MDIRNNENAPYYRELAWLYGRPIVELCVNVLHLLNPLYWINPPKDCLGDTYLTDLAMPFNKIHLIDSGARIEHYRFSDIPNAYATAKIERVLDRYFKNPEVRENRYELVECNGTSPHWYVYDRRMAHKKGWFDINFIDRCVQEVKRNIEEISADQMDKWSKCSDEKFFEHCFFNRVFNREVVVARAQISAIRVRQPIVDWGEELLPIYRLAISNLEQRLALDKASSQQGYLKNFVYEKTLENRLFNLGLKDKIKTLAFIFFVVNIAPCLWTPIQF